ncbi:hypothetical protein AVDCRST_MAG94-6997 [uncultured Leptolyngbya sp.]|uniref:Uncharacterized protein n=1 Tax=uncultured Leptolyngbya sp. TaxID=332963 RepID=A0A6J4PN28_9CYAN|nr:hypothetical protein AVDCRST_MAG94-6997 [uncultured Leptolyngbya sp.]
MTVCRREALETLLFGSLVASTGVALCCFLPLHLVLVWSAYMLLLSRATLLTL